MDAPQILSQLIELAREAGLEVRAIRGGAGGEGEPPASSGLCRVRGAPWIVLASSDSVEERIAVVSAALATHAPEMLERRYLPPAVRDRLGGKIGPP